MPLGSSQRSVAVSIKVRQTLAAVVVVLGLTVLASCQAGSGAGRGGSSAAAAAAPQKHWVQGRDLKATMDEIARLHGSLPKDLPEDVESPTGQRVAVASASAATLADALAQTATGLPRVLEGKLLSEADRRGFTALAETLRDQAKRLREESEKLQVERMQTSMEAITSTCMACHGRYRDLAGEADISKTLVPAGGRK